MALTSPKSNKSPRLLYDKKLTEATSHDVISTADVKAHVNVKHDDDDSLISAQIKAVKDLFVRVSGRCFNHQTRRAEYAETSRRARLPKIPVESIEAVEVLYQGSTQSLTASNFFLYGDAPVEVRAKSAVSWPSPRDAYRIEYKAGYASESEIPDGIPEVLKKMTADLYTNRTSIDITTSGTMKELPLSWRTLITPYVLPKL